MIYTQARRKALNKATRSMHPEVKFYESTDGVPIMECYELPVSAVRVTDPEEFTRKLKEKAVRINDMGTLIPDYGKALPVFIESMELRGNGSSREERFYRVNYVTISEGSLKKAEEYIAEGKLYTIQPEDTCNP